MRTEARRKYTCGFELTEQELRRVHDVADQQMKRGLPDGKYETAYEVRYQNGAIAEPKSLDEILAQENWGSTSIRLVTLTLADNLKDPKTKIGVTFADSVAMDNERSIAYEVEGEDRDWVFVASSQLSERISRIERLNLGNLVQSRSIVMLVMLGALVGMLVGTSFIKDPTAQKTQASIKALRQSWKSGDLRDPIDAVIRMEEIQAESRQFSPAVVFVPIFIPMVGLPLLFLGGLALTKYAFPPYNFAWGENLHEYEKKRGRRRFVLIGVDRKSVV